MTNRDPYARLLRWYPKVWRADHGAVFLDTLREQSEHEGRTRPSRSENLAAIVNGLGTRLDARLASRSALAGIIIGGALPTLAMTVMSALAEGGPLELLPDGVYIACFAVTSILVVAGIVALLRTFGVLSPARAVLVLALGCASLAVGAVAEYAWSMGFSQVDDNQAATGFATASGPLFGAAIVLGIVPAWLSMSSLLGRTRLGRGPRLALSLVAAGAITSIAGMALLMPGVWVSVALGVVALSLRSLGARRRSAVLTDQGHAPSRRLVRILAGLSLAIGLFGAFYSMTGSTWAPAGVDELGALIQGGLMTLAASFPLIAALGVLGSQQGRDRLHAWGPAILMGLAVTTLAVAYAITHGMWMILPFLVGGSAAAGAAIAWWITSRLASSREDRWVASASITCGCMAFYVNLPVLATVGALVLAAILATRGDLQLRRARTPDPMAAPLSGS